MVPPTRRFALFQRPNIAALAVIMGKNLFEVSEKLLSMGGSRFFKEVAIPITSEIRLIAEEHPTSQDQASFSGKPQAVSADLAGLIGVITFVSSWAVIKLLDEVYEIKIRPIIKDKIAKYIATNDSAKDYAISIAITNKSTLNTVFIVSIGKNSKEIDSNYQVEKNALDMAIQQQENTKLRNKTFVLLY